MMEKECRLLALLKGSLLLTNMDCAQLIVVPETTYSSLGLYDSAVDYSN